MRNRIAAFTTALLVSAGSAGAATVFYDMNLAGAASPSGWVEVPGAFGGSGGSISTTDAGSGQTVTLLVGNGQSSMLGRQRTLDKAGPAVTLDDMFNDFIIRVGGVEVTGLTPGGQYDISFIMYDDDEPNETVVQTITNTTGGGSDVLGQVSWSSATTLTSDTDQRLTAAGLVADGSGKLSFSISASGNGGNPLINGLIVSEVPEPGSLALLGIGGMSMLRRRR